MLLGYRSRSQSALGFSEACHVRTITWSCMVGFENKSVQMIIMTKQSVMNKNHVVRSESMSQSALKTLYRFQ